MKQYSLEAYKEEAVRFLRDNTWLKFIFDHFILTHNMACFDLRIVKEVDYRPQHVPKLRPDRRYDVATFFKMTATVLPNRATGAKSFREHNNHAKWASDKMDLFGRRVLNACAWSVRTDHGRICCEFVVHVPHASYLIVPGDDQSGQLVSFVPRRLRTGPLQLRVPLESSKGRRRRDRQDKAANPGLSKSKHPR